jgi:hypothetical protein
MWELLETIENSGFATWVRETPSVFGYSTVLALHTFGMAFLVGLSGVIAARVLGIIPGLPLAPLERFFPLIILGFWVNAVTGVCLRRLKSSAFGGEESLARIRTISTGKFWAGAMLAFWGIAIVAGRLTAYSNFVRRQTALATVIAVALLFAVRHVVRLIGRRLRLLPPRGSATPARVTPFTHY